MAIHWSPEPRRADPVERRRQRLAATRFQLLRERGVSERLLSVIHGQRDAILDALIEDWGLGAVEWLDDLRHDVPIQVGVVSLEPEHRGVYAIDRALWMLEGSEVRPVSELEVWQALFETRLELCNGTLRDACGRPLDRVVVRARLFELGGQDLSLWGARYLT